MPNFDVVARLCVATPDADFLKETRHRLGKRHVEVRSLVDEDVDVDDLEPKRGFGPRLKHWIRVDLGPGESIARTRDALAALGVKPAQVWQQPLTTPPPSLPSERRVTRRQVHLHPAPEGTGALRVRDVPGGSGMKGRLLHVEAGWGKHPDLIRDGSPLVSVVGRLPNAALAAHGVATMTLVAAQQNEIGGVGIAPDIRRIFASGSLDKFGRADPVNAILRVLEDAKPGDVLLLEIQGQQDSPDGLGVLAPADVDPGVHAAIWLATQRGVTVIEPAGNGGSVFDSPATNSEEPANAWEAQSGGDLLAKQKGLPLRRVTDNGAVLVGAAEWTDRGWELLRSSNRRRTMHCFAHGDSVVTGTTHTNAATLARSPAMTSNFGNTSAAAAIVAGVAVVVQAMARAQTGQVLSPAALRGILHTYGTPLAGAKTGPVLPDLEKIAKLDFKSLV